MTYVAVYLCPRWELPGSTLHQLPAGAEGQPVQPLVLQQGLLPLMPRRTTFDLLVQGCRAPAFLHSQQQAGLSEGLRMFTYTCSLFRLWREVKFSEENIFFFLPWWTIQSEILLMTKSAIITSVADSKHI